jgi:hypothetical protein
MSKDAKAAALCKAMDELLAGKKKLKCKEILFLFRNLIVHVLQGRADTTKLVKKHSPSTH